MTGWSVIGIQLEDQRKWVISPSRLRFAVFVAFETTVHRRDASEYCWTALATPAVPVGPMEKREASVLLVLADERGRCGGG